MWCHFQWAFGTSDDISPNLGVIVNETIGADFMLPTCVLNIVEVNDGVWYVHGPGSFILSLLASPGLTNPWVSRDSVRCCCAFFRIVLSNILPNEVAAPTVNFGPIRRVAYSHVSNTS